MRTQIGVGVVVLAALLGFSIAPRVRAHGGGGAATYDTASEVSISGMLAQPPSRGRNGLHLSVRESGGEMVDVRTAPGSYLASRGLSLSEGDEVEVTGSRMTVRGESVLVAREVTKQGRTIDFRDRAGKPLWR